MDSQAIAKLTKESVSRLTSEEYLAAHNDPTTGKDFAAKINQLDSQPRVATTATRAHGNVRQDAPSEQPAAQPFDPSFDELPGTEAPAAAAVAEPVAQPVVAQPVVTDFSNLPLLEHSYQPMVNGKKAGGLQNFKYRTVNDPNDPNSLVAQLQRAHSYASARIRTLSRDRKLDEITAAGAAPRIQPEKEIPATVEGLAAELRAQRESNFVLSVRAAVNEFQASMDWTKYRSAENAQSVVLAVERAGDDPTDPASYQRAFNNMQQFLEPVVVTPAPVAEVSTPAPAPAPVAATPAPAVSRVAYGVPTGISDVDAFNGTDPFEIQPTKVVGVRIVDGGKTTVMTLGEWNKMSSDSQKRILRSSANAAQIEALYEAADAAKAAARGGR